MRTKRSIYLVLLIIWMMTVFWFSQQASDKSSGTSENTIRIIINCLPGTNRLEKNEKEKIVFKLQPIVRKLAHFTLYTIGGIVIALYLNEYNLDENKKYTFSIFYGFLYAISDEIHQIFIPR